MSKPIARSLIPALIVTLAVAWAWLAPDSASLVAYFQNLGMLGPPLFVLLGALMMSLLTPKTVVSLAAGAVFGLVVGSATLSVTAMIAAGFNYLIGRWWLWRWVIQKQGNGWRKLHRIAGEAGFGTHLLFRLAPVPTSVISYTAGAAGARPAPFLLAAAVGSIPQWIWVHCGAVAGEVTQPDAGPRQWVSLVVSVSAAVAISVAIPRLASRELDPQPLVSPRS